MRQVLALVVGGAALAAAVHGCSGDPALYLGGPAGPMQDLSLSTNSVVMIVGQSVVVGGRGVDAVGNLTGDAVTFTSCDGSVVAVGDGGTPDGQFTSFASLAAAGLGEGCVVAQGGGFTDTIKVVVGPYAVAIVGDVIVGYDNQGIESNDFQFTVEAYDRDGVVLTGTAPMTWVSADKTRFAVDPVTGVVTTTGLGTADLRVTAPGGANAKVTLTVAAPAFTGTVSPTSGNQGTLVTLTRAAGGAEFDGNTTAYFAFGGVRTYVDNMTADELVVVVPAIGVAGRADLVIRGVGPADLDRRVVWTSPTTSLFDRYYPDNLDYTLGPDVDAVMSPRGNIYVASSGACATGGGADCDDFFTITGGAAGRTVTVTLDWINSAGAVGDMDILWTDENFTAYVGNFDGAGSAKPEVSTVTIPAGTTWRLWINNYTQGATEFSQVRVNLQ
jgi:hypothetical protein